MNSLWIILACGVACAFAQPTCNQDALIRCEQMTPNFDGGDMFPSDYPTLNKKCSESVPGYDCLVEVAQRCPDLVPDKFKVYYSAAQHFLRAVCTKGHYQTAYMRNAKCLNDVMKPASQSVCEARAAKVAKEYTCEYFRSIESCLKEAVRENCGEAAKGIFRDFFDVARLAFQNGACDDQ